MDTRHWTPEERWRVGQFLMAAFGSRLAKQRSMRGLHLATGLNRDPIRRLVRGDNVEDATVYIVEKGMGWQYGVLDVVARGEHVPSLMDMGVHPDLVERAVEVRRQRPPASA